MKERMLVVTMPGMDDETGVFIDYQQVFILIDDIEGDILRRDGEVMGLMIEQHLDDITGFDAVVGSDRRTVDPHITGIRSRLDAVTAGVGHMLGEVFVDTLFALPLIDLASPTLK